MSVAAGGLAEIYVYALQSREPFLEAFEVEMRDAADGTVLQTQSSLGFFNKDLDLWTQDGLMFFEGLERGTTYWFRARVRAAGGNYSAWSDYQTEVAGDVTAPTPTYASVPTFSDGQVRVLVTITPSGSDPDLDHYEVKTQINDPSAPVAATRPTFADLRDSGGTITFDIQMAQTDVGYAWIRAVDTSGNRQVWVQLHPTGGYSLIVANVTIVSTLQATITVGKNLEAIIQFTYGAPNDTRFGGVELWVQNYRNLGKVERVGKFKAQAIGVNNSFKAQMPLDYGGPLVGAVSHTVTFYLVSFTTDEILRLPILSAPSTAFTPGITGAYAGPTDPWALTAFQLGAAISVTWNDNGDPNTAQYNLYRQFVGNVATPITPVFANSDHIATMDKFLEVGGSSSFYRWMDHGGFIAADVDPANPLRLAYWVEAVSMDGTRTTPIGPSVVTLRTVGPGDVDNEEQDSGVNKLYNADLFARLVTTFDVPMQNDWRGVTAVSVANPAVYTVNFAHGLAVGDMVLISNVQDAFGAAVGNGFYSVKTVPSTTTFTTGYNSLGNTGPIPTGGTPRAYSLEAQPKRDLLDSGLVVPDGSPWQATTNAGVNLLVPWWKSDGNRQIGAIALVEPGIGGWSKFYQVLAGKRFADGEHVVVSFYAKNVVTGTGLPRVDITFANNSTMTFYIDRSLLTSTYQRFAINLQVPSGATFPGGYCQIEFWNDNSASGVAGGSWQITRPMINRGDNISGWTADRGTPGGGDLLPTPPDVDPTLVPRNRRDMVGHIIRRPPIVY